MRLKDFTTSRLHHYASSSSVYHRALQWRNVGRSVTVCITSPLMHAVLLCVLDGKRRCSRRYYIYNTSLVPRRRPNQPFNVDGFSVYVILNATRARVGWVWLALAQYRMQGRRSRSMSARTSGCGGKREQRRPENWSALAIHSGVAWNAKIPTGYIACVALSRCFPKAWNHRWTLIFMVCRREVNQRLVMFWAPNSLRSHLTASQKRAMFHFSIHGVSTVR